MPIYFLSVILLVLIGYGGLYFWRHKITSELSEGAGVEYDLLKKNDPDLLFDVGERQFRNVYTYVHFPRLPQYVLGALTAFLLGTPIALGILSAGAWTIDHFTEKPASEVLADVFVMDGDGSIQVFEGNQTSDFWYYLLEDFSGFYYFFGLLLFWIMVFYIAMKLYYKHIPGSVRDEILRAR